MTARPADQGSAQLKWFSGTDACEQLRGYLAASVLAGLGEDLLALRARVVASAASGRIEPSRVVDPRPAMATTKPGPSTRNANLRLAAATPAPGASSLYGPVRASTPRPGVDEADFVRRDGDALWLLSLNQVAPGLTLQRVDLLAAGDLAAGPALSWQDQAGGFGSESIWGLHPLDSNGLAVLSTGLRLAATLPGQDAANPGRVSLPESLPVARVRLIDTATATPDERWQTDLPGHLLASRRVGKQLQLVTVSDLPVPMQVASAQSLGMGAVVGSAAAMVATIDDQIIKNEAAVQAVTLADWLAPLGLAQPPTAEQCAQMARVDAPTRPALLALTTIDVTTGISRQRIMLAPATAAVQARHSLLLATPSLAEGAAASTYLHRFAVDEAGSLDYDGSAAIEGTLATPDAIDERDDGIVRVAAREDSPSGQAGTYYLANWQPQPAPARWQALGRSDPLLTGRTVERVAFLADRAMLATNLDSDPLYLINLALPGRPASLGTLDVPGNAAWVSAVSPDRLLTISDVGGAWAAGGSQAQVTARLFDVSQADHPALISRLGIGSVTNSAAYFDGRAATTVTYSGAGDGLLAVTVQAAMRPPGSGTGPWGIDLVSVDPARGGDALVSIGMLDTDMIDIQSDGWPVRPMIIGEHLYVASPLGVRSAALTTPAITLDTVRLDPGQ